MARDKLLILSVSQVNAMVNEAIRRHLPSRFILRGEISDWKRHQSGHCYFILKDTESQISCVLWARQYQKLKFQPENGMEILATGHVEVYSTQGKFQFYAEDLQPAGIGALQIAFQQMYEKLKAEGLFEERYKKPIPQFPQRIGIVTSKSGAAVHDIADSIWHRWPIVRLFLFDVPVQGEGAAEEIARKLDWINRNNKQLQLDLLIVGRGGGSMEDLWAFNEEVLARAIFRSKIPIISAVGHEIDTTIADLAADARASTPTKAGMLAVPDQHEVLKQLGMVQRRLVHSMHSAYRTAWEQLRTILASWVFREPQGMVERAWQRVDMAALHLAGVMRERFDRLRRRLEQAKDIVRRLEPVRLIAGQRLRLERMQAAARQGLSKVLEQKRLQLSAAENKLTAMDPRAVLRRGYTITINMRTGQVIRRLEEVDVGDVILTELAQRLQFTSRVEEMRSGKAGDVTHGQKDNRRESK
ncbi:MAG TPA: exodeoxyribonuclease VII large subunit [Anaerohalosphaeraceae bacterium]|nr:exodeoxyribonuclease VII large subunit [Anaerohalosphaeraceae bacterium]